jgi:YhcH/YjgK/YiaL family protein
MIVDRIENINTYSCLHTRMRQAIDYLIITDFTKMAPGKYTIDGENLFVLVNHYDTKANDDCLLEAHKKYIDFQYILSGCEKIGFVTFSDQITTREYDAVNDYALFKPENLSLFKLTAGMFAIFFPNDLHMPGIICNKTESVIKIVIKILI